MKDILPGLILSHIGGHHRGMENAIKRRDLLRMCRSIEPEITDREMRKIVEGIPRVCTCERGYYVAVKPDEVKHSSRYLRKKAYPLFDRANRIEGAYPEFFNGQMELF